MKYKLIEFFIFLDYQNHIKSPVLLIGEIIPILVNIEQFPPSRFSINKNDYIFKDFPFL